MSTASLSKFCAVCKLGNEPDALVCEHCGAVFVDLHLDQMTTKKIAQGRSSLSEIPEDKLVAPESGVAFFLYGRTEAYSIKSGNEIYLGRPESQSVDVFVDLTMADGFAQGVSRRHARIQRVEDRYEIIDLRSANGTYLEGKRLVPYTPYELRSGTLIQLGNLKLIAIFS